MNATSKPPLDTRTPAPYARFAVTAAMHTLDTLPRRRISYFAAFLAYLPIVVPLALFFSKDLFYEPNGSQVFVRIVQFMYINTLVPLLALFFGSTLVGEDIESNTFPYILTRPIPRSAWILGKFMGYWLGVSALLGVSLTLTFVISTQLADFSLDSESMTMLAKYLGAMVMGLGAYGALSLFLGAFMKRPIIWGIVLVFFWQRIALALPGYVDFLTIDKYVTAIMPEVEGMPSVLEMAAQALGVGKLIVEVQPIPAFFTLIGIMAGFVALAAYVVRGREYTAAHAAGT